LAKTEKALAYAEKQPSQKNYDEAATLVSSLSQEYEEYNDRLEKIKEAVPVDEAVTTAEKEKNEQLVASATAAVEKAEQEPTNEAYYNEAIKQIDALNSPNQALTKRVAVVKTQLDAHKEKQRKEAEAQKLAAEKAQKEQAEAAAKAQAEAEAQQAAQAPTAAANAGPETSATILVTPTGSKYHARKCGNGTYTATTLADAQARGLTPCSKCY